MSKWITLTKDTEVKEILAENPNFTSIVLFKPVQSGKTADVLKLAEAFYKESAIVFISDKNTALAGQTTGRARLLGFDVVSYRDDIKLGKFLRESVGKKRIIHLLMETHNLKAFEDMLFLCEDLPVSIFIDEADKSRNTIDANEKKSVKRDKKLQEEDEESNELAEIDSDDDATVEVADGTPLPPVTMSLLEIKNMVKGRKNSRTVFISATPAAILTAEKDDWLVLYKEPYLNYVGIGLKHEAEVLIFNKILNNICKARDRWTGEWEDAQYNTFAGPLAFGVEQFSKAPNKQEEGSDIVQLCLVSLENRKLQQFLMAEFITNQLELLGETGNVGMFVMNSDTKENSEETLASLIQQQREAGKRKIIIIAGFMASRGVSFTDYSDKANQFELIMQIHYTKKNFPLNSSMQNMRIFGPKRRTVSRPAIICNDWAEQDIKVNFLESYRIIKELAEYGCATRGRYNSLRPITQPYNFRYLKQGSRSEPGKFIYPSTNEADWLPISV